MKRILTLIILLAALTSQAATVHYSITNFDLTVATNALKITQVTKPKIDGTTAIIGVPKWVTIVNGLGTNTLAIGYYSTTFQGYPDIAPIYFEVTNNVGTYDWVSLWRTSTNVGSGLTAYPAAVANTLFYPRTSNPSNYATVSITNNLIPKLPNLIPSIATYTGADPIFGAGYYPVTVVAGHHYYLTGTGSEIIYTGDGTDTAGANSGLVFTPVGTAAYLADLGYPSSGTALQAALYSITNTVVGAFYGLHYGTFSGDASLAVGLNGANLTNIYAALPGYLQHPRAILASANVLRNLSVSNTPSRFLRIGDSFTYGQANESAPSAAIRLLEIMFGNAGTAMHTLDTSFNGGYFSRPELNVGLTMTGAGCVRATDGASGLRSLQSSTSAALVPVNRVQVFYYAWPGGGTTSINLTNGTTNVTVSVNGFLAGATNVLSTNFWVVASTNNAVFVTSTVATNICLGVEYSSTNSPGVVDAMIALGGTDIANNLFSMGTNALASLCRLLAPDQIWHDSLHFPPNTLADLTNEIRLVRGTSTSNAVLVIAPNPPDYGLAAQNPILQQAVAVFTNAFYIDLYDAIPSFATNTTAGIMFDTLHLNDAGAAVCGAEILRQAGFNQPGRLGANGAVTNGATGVTLSGTFSGNGSGLTLPSVAITNTQVGASLGTLTNSTLTANRAVVSDANKVETSSATTDTEIGYVSGVTSGIQAQLNAKAGTNAPTLFTVTHSGTFTAKANGTNEFTIQQGGTATAGTNAAARFVYNANGPLPTISITVTNQSTWKSAGTTPTMYFTNSAVLNDSSMTLCIIPGGTVTASTNICTIAWGTPAPGNKLPNITISPANAPGSATVKVFEDFTQRTTNGFTLASGTSPLVTATVYFYTIHVDFGQ